MDDRDADGWTALAEAPDVLGAGLFLRFATPDAPGIPVIALGVALHGAPALSFFAVQGASPGLGMGYGQPTLPIESTQDGNRHTVRRDWLLENFDHIAMDVDMGAVGYAVHLQIAPLYLDRPGYPHKDLVME